MEREADSVAVEVFEQEPPLAIRFGLGVVWAGLVAFAVFGPSHDGRGLDLFAVGAALGFAGRYLPVRRRGGTYRATLTAGAVRLSGVVPEVVRSRQVLGAALLDADEGTSEILLSLKGRGAMRLRAAPKDAMRLLHALNVPAAGKGEVDVTLAPQMLDFIEMVLRVVTASLFLVTLVIRDGDVLFALAIPQFIALLASLSLMAAVRMVARPTLSISPDAVAVRTWEKRESLPRADISDVEVGDHELVLRRAGRPPVRVGFRRPFGIGVDPALAQRLSRALPRAASPRDVEVLARGDADLRGWLTRLDRLGGESGAAYRGEAPTDAELWTVLESPDYEPDLRGAAARVLGKRAPDELRVRIAPVLEAIGDAEVRKRVEVVALAPIDEVEPDEAPARSQKNVPRPL